MKGKAYNIYMITTAKTTDREGLGLCVTFHKALRDGIGMENGRPIKGKYIIGVSGYNNLTESSKKRLFAILGR